MTTTRYVIEAFREGYGWYPTKEVPGTIFDARAALFQLELERPTQAFRITDKLAPAA